MARQTRLSGLTKRRAFLARGARWVGAGLAAPLLAAGFARAATAYAANERVGVGVIGVGGMGGGHLGRYLRHAEFPALAVCDVDERHLDAAFGRMGPHATKHRDYRALLDRQDLGAVVIATPDHWHAPIAVRACQAGKDVYCEKPLSLTVRQGRAMVDAARRYGRVVQTGSQQRSSEEFRRACELVRSGRIGRVDRVRVNVWGTSRPCHLPAEPSPPWIDWELWLGPSPWRPFHSGLHPYRWRDYREFSGGTMTDWGAHHLDIAQWGLGTELSGPCQVLPPAPGKSFVTFVYTSGVVVECGDVGVNGVEFAGAGGRITVNRGFFRSQPEEAARAPLGAHEVSLPRSPGHHEDWEQCIRSRRRPIADVEIGHRSVTLCHLANIALWSGRSIVWDPVAEAIAGDEQASRWLDRPARAPYGV